MFYFSLVKGLAHGLLSSESPQCRVLCCIVPKAAFQLLEYWKIIGDPLRKGKRDSRSSRVSLTQTASSCQDQKRSDMARGRPQSTEKLCINPSADEKDKQSALFFRPLSAYLITGFIEVTKFRKMIDFLFENYKGWSCDTVKSKYFISSNNLFL